MRLTGDHQKYFWKIFFLIFLFFFKERWFFAVFSWGRMVLETYAYPFGYFWRFKIDEILMSFYPWFFVWYCLFGFFKSSQVFAKHGFASVLQFYTTVFFEWMCLFHLILTSEFSVFFKKNQYWQYSHSHIEKFISSSHIKFTKEQTIK